VITENNKKQEGNRILQIYIFEYLAK